MKCNHPRSGNVCAECTALLIESVLQVVSESHVSPESQLQCNHPVNCMTETGYVPEPA